MDLGQIRLGPAIVAAAASFGFGAVYYTVLSKQWLEGIGKTEEEVQKERTRLPFIISFVGLVVMAAVLSGVMNSGAAAIMEMLGASITVGQAATLAFYLWLGFIASSMATNYAFQGAKLNLALLDLGHWLGVIIIQAVVLSLF